jgi:hypothetical protein
MWPSRALTLRLAITAAAAPPAARIRTGLLRPVMWRQDRAARRRARGDSLALRLGADGLPRRLEVLGFVGVVIGPVVLTLTRELWEQRVRDLLLQRLDSTSPFDNRTVTFSPLSGRGALLLS